MTKRIVGLNWTTADMESWHTDELIEHLGLKLTEDQRMHIGNLGVNRRYLTRRPHIEHLKDICYRTFTESDYDKHSIDNIIVASEIADYQTPGLAGILIAEMGLKKDIPYYHLQGQACSSMFRICELANRLPGNTLCIISGITSPMYQSELAKLKGVDIKKASSEWTKTCFGLLFGDCVCGFVFTEDNRAGWEYLEHKHILNLDKNDYKTAAVKRTDDGFDMFASSLITQRALSMTHQVLAQMNWQFPNETKRIFLHTGSQRIIDAYQERFDFSDYQLSPSRKRLEDLGNTTGCTVPTTMDYFKPEYGDTAMAIGITMGLGLDIAKLRYTGPRLQFTDTCDDLGCSTFSLNPSNRWVN